MGEGMGPAKLIASAFADWKSSDNGLVTIYDAEGELLGNGNFQNATTAPPPPDPLGHAGRGRPPLPPSDDAAGRRQPPHCSSIIRLSGAVTAISYLRATWAKRTV
ncbi:hypothetical protein HTV45_20625 [Streptomyces sp. CHD11]|uniref:hypothetical protein n=1 Tax=Streptomyces sp. CHD11 TaxID=2741325 RepID=UPI001BFCD3B8|nr:hypothetical protein [Streptomyces sp. CHD11]MBT3153240.1 hypothetical protein [Streptomyces sp. CHD11]